MPGTREAIAEQLRALQPANRHLSVDYLTQVQAGFSFRQQAGDEQFYPLHIEPLLDQAADLLDRGLTQRASWDALAVQMTQQWLELGKFAEEDAVRREEDAAGLHALPFKEAGAVAESERVSAKTQTALADQIGRIVSSHYSGAVINEQLDAIRKGAFLSGVAAYEYQGQKFSGYINHTYTPVGAAPITGRVQDFALQSAEKIGRRTLRLQQDETDMQKHAYEAAAAVSMARIPGLEARANFAQAAEKFSKQRVEIDRKYFEFRQRAATEADGALNFARRLAGIRDRFSADFRAALARLKAIQPGLKMVYGYELHLPADETAVDYFDQCLLETRNALEWLVRFSRYDQTAVVPLSLRRLAGDSGWTSGLSRGEWNFDVSLHQFRAMSLVRLRGLTAFAEFGGPRTGMASIEITVPPMGAMDGPGGAISLDQTKLPPCRLFRVQERQANRDSDVVGVALLHNASPIGRWTVKLEEEPTQPLTNLYVDVLVNFRSKSAT